MNSTWSSILSSITSLAGAALGATPWGAGVLAGVVALFVVGGVFAVKYFNSKVDSADQDHAGADASQTAADMANQAAQVTQGLDSLEQTNPPGTGESK